MNDQKPYTIIKLGGSIIVPDQIDCSFLETFREMILRRVNEGERFAIIVGGGRTSRNYQKALYELGVADDTTNDWMAIYSLRLNAELVRLAFGEAAYGTVINELSMIEGLDGSSVVIVGAEAPGHSSDYNAVRVADILGAQCAAILSNVEYIYSGDPRTHHDAQRFEEISWSQYRALIPSEWTPNMSAPIDPVAAELAEKTGLEVAMMNGRDLENFERYLDTEDFQGTRVHA